MPIAAQSSHYVRGKVRCTFTEALLQAKLQIDRA